MLNLRKSYNPKDNVCIMLYDSSQYNRGVRACKLIMESLFCKKWEIVLPHIKANGLPSDEELDNMCGKIQGLQAAKWMIGL